VIEIKVFKEKKRSRDKQNPKETKAVERDRSHGQSGKSSGEERS
jgi:hypothetical protein